MRELAAPELKAERKRKAAKEWDAANPERKRERLREHRATDDYKAKQAAYMREYRARRAERRK